MITAIILAATFTVTVPAPLLGDLDAECVDHGAQRNADGPITRQECLQSLVNEIVADRRAQRVRNTERQDARDKEQAERRRINRAMPVPFDTCVCGDGDLDGCGAGETCDDGNTTPGDGCDAECQIEVP